MSDIQLNGVAPMTVSSDSDARTITLGALGASSSQVGTSRAATINELMQGIGVGGYVQAQHLQTMISWITGGGPAPTPPIGDMGIGDEIVIDIGGDGYHFLIVHKGNPSAALYPSEFDNGVIVMMKNLYGIRPWHTSYINDYANSDIHKWLNNEFSLLIDSVIMNQIKAVLIPYRSGSGTSTSVQSGVNGLSCHVFLLSGREVGSGADTNLPNDGATLDYFTGIENTSANDRRRATLNGTNTTWFIRTPYTAIDSAWLVGTNGNLSRQNVYSERGVRPAFVLPSTLQAPIKAATTSLFQGTIDMVQASGNWTAPADTKVLFVLEGDQDGSLLVDMQEGEIASIVVGAAGGTSMIDVGGQHIEQSSTNVDGKVKIVY